MSLYSRICTVSLIINFILGDTLQKWTKSFHSTWEGCISVIIIAHFYIMFH